MPPHPSPPLSPPSFGRTLLAALQFYTMIPLYKAFREPTGAEMAAGHSLLPVVGALVGLIQGLGWWAMSALFRQPFAAAVAAAISWWLLPVLLTRGLHEDGLADFADGLGAGGTVERRLAIMKDSRIGAFGVLALIADAMIGVSATALIAASGAPRYILGALLAAAVLPRAAALVLTIPLPYARAGGGGIVTQTPIRLSLWFWLSTAILGAISAVLMGLAPLLLAAFATAAVGGSFYLALNTTLGGYTGDCLGAAIKIGTLAVVVTCAGYAG